MWKDIIKSTKKQVPFLGGIALGSVGLKLLASRPAKKLYANVIAQGYHVKDEFDKAIDQIREQTGDVMADAHAIYEQDKAEDAEALFAEAEQKEA